MTWRVILNAFLTILVASIAVWCFIDFSNGKDMAFNLVTGIMNTVTATWLLYLTLDSIE